MTMTVETPLADAKREVPAAFNRVARRYDLLTGLNPGYRRHLRYSAERLALRERSRAPVVYAELYGAHHAFDVFYSPRTQEVIRGVDRFLSWVYGEHQRARAA